MVSPLWAQKETTELNAYVQMLSLKALPTPEKRNRPLYQLGSHLFHDKRLSGKENISCAHCHSLTTFSGDSLPLGIGEGAEGLGKNRYQAQGLILARHSPALYNLGLPGVLSLFWDARVQKTPQGWLTPEPGLNGPSPELQPIASKLDSILAVQALFPIASPEEMLGQGSPLSRVAAWKEVMERLIKVEKYQKMFKEAYPLERDLNIAHVANALAEFQKYVFLANRTPWDEYLNGQTDILSARMKRGANLFFGKAMCVNCHTGPHFTSFGFQNINVPQLGPGVKNGDDKGRYEVTGQDSHLYRFRVSPLRNVALTSPYMHTGAFRTMWEVIDHYDRPLSTKINWNPNHPQYREPLHLDQNSDNADLRARTLAMNLPRELNLTSDEKSDLYCFLMVALTDLSQHRYLKGVLDEVSDCSPLSYQRSTFNRSGSGKGRTKLYP